LLPQTSSGPRNTDIVLVDDNGDYKDKDIESDDSDEEFKDTGKHTYQRSYSTRNTKTIKDEYEERSPDGKRKSSSPALSANKKIKSQGIHEKVESGADVDRKMPAVQLKHKSKPMRRCQNLRSRLRRKKKRKPMKIRKITFKMTIKKHLRNKSSICETVQCLMFFLK